MKTVWIVLAVILGLGLLCCGGVLFTCNRVVGAMAKYNDAADRFAKKVFEETAADWDPDKLLSYAAPELKKDMSDPQVRDYLKTLKDRLGKFKSIGEFTATNTSINSDNGETVVRVKTGAPTAMCEKGTASVQIEVVNRNDKWGVASFFVTPHD